MALRPALAAALAAMALASTAWQVQALGPGSRIPWLGGTWYLHGVNYPWNNYGTDFGHNAWGADGVHTAASNTTVDADFAAMQAEGVHVARWWVFADGRAGITFSGGLPMGVDSDVYPDLDAALQIAARHDVYLDLVLLDFSWMSDANVVNGVQLGGHANVINTSAGRQSLLDNVFVPLFKRYGRSSQVLAYEVMNEPEWAITEDGAVNSTVSTPSSLANFQAFTSAVAAAVHANTASYVTVGEAAMKWAAQWQGLGLDFYEIHYYDWMNPFPITDLYGSTYAALHLDAPVVVGEFPATGSTTATLPQYLDTWSGAGYAGAWPWSFKGVDSNGAPAASTMLGWNNSHAAAVDIPMPGRAAGGQSFAPSPAPRAPAAQAPATSLPPAGSRLPDRPGSAEASAIARSGTPPPAVASLSTMAAELLGGLRLAGRL